MPARLFGTYRPAAVVLNAGATPVIAPLDEHDWDTFSVNWNVDVRQAFHFVQQALRTPPPNGGVVVTMSSGAALAGSPMSGGYAGAEYDPSAMTSTTCLATWPGVAVAPARSMNSSSVIPARAA